MKNKTFAVTLILIVIVIFIASTFSMFFNLNRNKNTSTALTTTINSKQDFLNFANEVALGNTFSGLTVNLNCDIDGGDESFSGIGTYDYSTVAGQATGYSFAGVFNGNGHCIKNFNLTNNCSNSTQKIRDQKKYTYTHTYYASLFVLSSNGVIKNLEINKLTPSYTLPEDETGSGHWHLYKKGTNKINIGGVCRNCLINSNLGVESAVDCYIINKAQIYDKNGNVQTKVSSAINNINYVGNESIGSSSDSNPWFYDGSYNGGWPYLRAFMTTVSVTFNYNYSGAGSESKTYYKDTQYGYFPTPTRDHYRLVGWYQESSCTTSVNVASNVTGDITLYAKWELNQHDLTINFCGETSVVKVDEGSSVTATLNSALDTITIVYKESGSDKTFSKTYNADNIHYLSVDISTFTMNSANTINVTAVLKSYEFKFE